jgi:hypothetical protein
MAQVDPQIQVMEAVVEMLLLLLPLLLLAEQVDLA